MATVYTDYIWVAPDENIKVSTSSVESVPSNKNPLIDLTCNGLLLPLAADQTVYTLLLTFTGSDFPQKDVLNGSYGTLCIGKKVLNASKIIRTKWDKENKTLAIVIDLRKTYSCSVRRATRFSFSIQVNDCSFTNCDTSSPNCGNCDCTGSNCSCKTNCLFSACYRTCKSN